MNYKHFILIRFNLQMEANDRRSTDIHYLQHRCALFEQFTLPSLRKQTCQMFECFLFADERTPECIKERFQSYTHLLPTLQIIYLPYLSDYNPSYRQICLDHLGDASHLISTRLDNDDMLAFRYVENSQAYIHEHHLTHQILNFVCGVQYFTEYHLGYMVHCSGNHFTTFVEPRNKVCSALGVDHTKIDAEKVINIHTPQPAWCEVVHTSNVSNGVLPNLHYLPGKIPSGLFPVEMPSSNGWSKWGFWLKSLTQYYKKSLKRHLSMSAHSDAAN